MACILVAEDDPVQAELRRCVLERAGHQVRVAADRDAALGYLETADVVLMDLRFPALDDGLALIRRFTAHRSWCSPVGRKTSTGRRRKHWSRRFWLSPYPPAN